MCALTNPHETPTLRYCTWVASYITTVSICPAYTALFCFNILTCYGLCQPLSWPWSPLNSLSQPACNSLAILSLSFWVCVWTLSQHLQCSLIHLSALIIPSGSCCKAPPTSHNQFVWLNFACIFLGGGDLKINHLRETKLALNIIWLNPLQAKSMLIYKFEVVRQPISTSFKNSFSLRKFYFLCGLLKG